MIDYFVLQFLPTQLWSTTTVGSRLCLMVLFGIFIYLYNPDGLIDWFLSSIEIMSPNFSLKLVEHKGLSNCYSRGTAMEMEIITGIGLDRDLIS